MTAPEPFAPRFIAEVSSNHACDLDRCIAFIRAAAESGCDAVKFQLFKIDQLFAPEVLANSAEHRARKDWELPVAFLPDLAAACREHGVAFGCTPFYLDAVADLEPHVDFYKIASYEMIWDDLIRTCAQTGKPVIVSSGMADLAEVEHAVSVARGAGVVDLSLMHCVSAYPTPAADCNLAAIKTMRDATGCAVGWSDHTVSPAVLFRAVHAWGANAVEFHLDLEGDGAEYASGHCWLPYTIAPVIQAIRDGCASDGDGIKQPVAAEAPDRAWRADPEDGLRPIKETRASLP